MDQETNNSQSETELQSSAPATETQTNESEGDADKHKALAIVGYIIPILFFLPLITDAKDSKFAKFHANQQLNFLLLLLAGQVIGMVLTLVFIGLLILALLPVVWIIYMIIGIINVSNAEMKPLPIIGKYNILNLK